MGRREEALNKINLKGAKGLELGPLFEPLVTKDQADIFYLDHLSTENLKKKYHGYGIPLENIVAVDYVLRNNSLKSTLKGKKFNYVLASHVIEHIPDIVRWLQDVSSVLDEEGILSLVIPDKRFTFDILRNESRPADVIGAYLDQQTRPSSVVLYDFVSSVRRGISAAEVWANPNTDYSKRPKNTREYIKKMCDLNLHGEYVDTHCHVFTPYSFFEIIRELIKHDLFNYEVVYFGDTPQNQLEFYVSLRKSIAPRAKKLRSLPKVSKPSETWELNARIHELENYVNHLEGHLQSLTSSSSWRVTQPLRKTSLFVKKIIRRQKSV